MKPFTQRFFAVLAAGAVVASGYFLLQRHTARHDREQVRDAIKLAAARDAITDWTVRLENATQDIARGTGFTPVEPFLEAYKNVQGWLPFLPEKDRGFYERELAAARDKALASLRHGGPEWQQLKDAMR